MITGAGVGLTKAGLAGVGVTRAGGGEKCGALKCGATAIAENINVLIIFPPLHEALRLPKRKPLQLFLQHCFDTSDLV